MNDIDQSYYLRRAAEERTRADKAERPETRRVHAELADRYTALVRPPAAARPAS